jgi:hypothetical protein
MIKRLVLIIGLLAAVLPLLPAGLACSGSSDYVTASIGREFTLPVGKSVSFTGEELSLKFVEVTADSRCPTGVQCIQAGEADCRMQVTYKGLTMELNFIQPGSSQATQKFVQYTINFRVEPYPQAGKQIKKSDYRLVMTVTK